MYYHFKIHHHSDGLWAECIELSGCLTQANNISELLVNMREVLNLYLDEPSDSTTAFSLPKKNIKETKNIVKVKVAPKIAFAFYLRMLRLKHNLTQKEIAQKLGFKNLYSYQRLESSKKANPELITLVKIKEILPDFDLNLLV